MKKLWGYLFLALGCCISTYCLMKTIDAANVKLKAKEQEIKKYKLYYYLCSSWVDIKSNGKNIAEYLKRERIYTIAVYGMGDMGVKLCKELQGTDIDIKYVMDQDVYADTIFAPIKKLDEKLPKVDAIIVTPCTAYSQIKNNLSSKTDSKIISIEDIIFNA